MRPDLWHRRGPSSERRGLAGDPTADSSLDYCSPPSSRQRSDPRLARDRSLVPPDYPPLKKPRRLQSPSLRPPPSGPHTCTRGCAANPAAVLAASWTPHEPASTVSPMAASIDFTIAFEPPDEDGWIVARVLEVPGAMSQGRTRDEARENALDALSTVLTPDEELAGGAPQADREHLRFTAAA